MLASLRSVASSAVLNWFTPAQGESQEINDPSSIDNPTSSPIDSSSIDSTHVEDIDVHKENEKCSLIDISSLNYNPQIVRLVRIVADLQDPSVKVTKFHIRDLNDGISADDIQQRILKERLAESMPSRVEEAPRTVRAPRARSVCSRKSRRDHFDDLQERKLRIRTRSTVRQERASEN